MAKAFPEPARVVLMTAALAGDAPDPARALSIAAAATLRVAGAGILLISGGNALESMSASSPMTEAVEEVQYTLGEGPGVDAFRSKAPVLAPDLANPELTRWPGFQDGAQAAGVRAAFGFPLLVESVSFGALNLYNGEPGALSDEQTANAVAVAYVISRTVLTWQTVAATGSLAWQLAQLPTQRAVIHQAVGMVSVQAAVTIGTAATLMRAYAFAEDRPIAEVAKDVVNRLLRFEV